jgi:hypothetical protein
MGRLLAFKDQIAITLKIRRSADWVVAAVSAENVAGGR